MAVNMGTIIPYNPSLRNYFKSITACLLFQQLCYWAERAKTADGSFYKFTKAAPNHSFYKKGDSWCEELNFSKDEFDTAKREIVMHYASREEWLKGRLNSNSSKSFSSYYDRQNHLVRYFANWQIIDDIRGKCDISQNKQGDNSTLEQGGKATMYKVEKPPSTKWQSRFRSIQEINQKNTHEITLLTSSEENVSYTPKINSQTYKKSKNFKRKRKQKPKTKQLLNSDNNQAFEEFWGLQGCPVDKKLSRKEFDLAVERAGSGEVGRNKIIYAAKMVKAIRDKNIEFKIQTREQARQFSKRPLGWLRDDRWEDSLVMPEKPLAVNDNCLKSFKERDAERSSEINQKQLERLTELGIMNVFPNQNIQKPNLLGDLK